ncbi:DUF3016 domain-containing protein [Duganella sp. sic0402]|uniref:DUF3016 domain-containing protein n=1 Tax=Duganella sp. sic0402 TaxID=2854786 RepID=UPI001C43F1F3|nr:DUF3016 domain-containing protein [Duganella sp. sic0402]MBV7538057.1 DUF3016 domain-containing protein [Duganella sp. sic0402]
MKTPSLKTAAAIIFAAASASAAAEADVSYINATEMTDVPRHHKDLETMEFNFTQHLKQLSEQLPAGQVLKVAFLDIDLAGDVFPRVPVRDIRVTKGQADWPRMHLRYSIEQDGKAIRSGEAKLSDPNYQMGVNTYQQDLYGYEKQMLDKWFRKEILPPKR